MKIHRNPRTTFYGSELFLGLPLFLGTVAPAVGGVDVGFGGATVVFCKIGFGGATSVVKAAIASPGSANGTLLPFGNESATGHALTFVGTIGGIQLGIVRDFAVSLFAIANPIGK
ncbi:hypothetical protein HanPSC8_Chr15g0677621 [Helianthus annuus]|nr:hypothetical protein HanPSC8_Chr15g0677621 [Helianthus annuus]